MRRLLYEFKDLFKVEGLLFIFFLAACFTHNMDFGSIVYVSLIVLLLVRFLFVQQKQYMDRTAFYLILFAIFYILISPSFILADAVRIILGPVAFYIYGRYSVQKNFFNSSLIKKEVLLMIICMSFPVWWAVVSNMLAGNIVSTTSIEGARWLTVWGQSNKASATTYGLIASFGLCGFGYFLASKEKFKSIDPWLFLLCSILSILITTYLINRSGLVIVSVVAIIALFYSTSKFDWKSFILLLPFAIVILYYILGSGSAGDVFEAYSDRESIAGGGDRTWRWVDALQRLLTDPLGWANNDHSLYIYVHNMWLDIARVAGIIPFFFMLMATIRAIRTNIILYKEKNNEIALLGITLFSSIFCSYMIEPVIEANIFYLMIFAWIWGVEREVACGIKRSYRVQ